MDVISSTLELEYEKLRAKVSVQAAKFYFNRQDTEDILHDCVLDILENRLLPDHYCDAVSRVLSSWRTSRSRRRSRGI